MVGISFGRLTFITLVVAIFTFLIAPLLTIIWASFFIDKILTFPPTGYTLSWYARAWVWPISPTVSS